MKKWLLRLAHRCIQLDADQILGIHGSPGNHIIPMLLNDCFTFIPCCYELHFHSLQSSLHEVSIGGVCQQLVEVLPQSDSGLGSFLTQHVHVFEYERCLFESNESIVNVNNLIQVLRPFARQ